MKRQVAYTGFAILSMLMLLVSVTGDGSANHYNTKMEMDRFQMGSEYMSINGSVDITDEGVVFSVSMSPNGEAMRMMGDEEMMGNRGPRNTPQGEDRPFKGDISDLATMSNSMNVTLYALAEFEDTGIEGFDSEDKVLSIYYLNTSTLDPLEYDGNGAYAITSPDGVFSLDLTLNQSSVIAWKWSVNIKYPYTSNTSSIAMLHEFSTMFNDIRMQRTSMKKHQMGGGMNSPPTNSNYTAMQNKSMVSEGKGAPMFFSWADTAEVDGTNTPVVVTRGDVLAISVPQGESIFYDPAIGVTTDVVDDIDGEFALLTVEETSTTDQSSFYFPAAILSLVIAIPILRRKN